MGKGKEMTKVLLGIFALGITLIFLTLLFTSLYPIGQIEENEKNIKNKVISQLADYFQDTLSSTLEFAQSVALSGYSPDLLQQALLGNPQKLIYFVLRSLQETYSAEYISLVSDGKVIGMVKEENVNDEQISMIKDIPSEGYQVLPALGGEQGVFISIFQPLSIPLFGEGDQYINLVIDRTEQLKSLEKIYANQRKSLVKRQIIIGIVTLAVAALLSFIVIRILIDRYIVEPITDLNRRAEEIIQGTYHNHLEVVEGSAYAPLQRLVQSGSIIFAQNKGEAKTE